MDKVLEFQSKEAHEGGKTKGCIERRKTYKKLEEGTVHKEENDI
jgi:hypothetical protein